MTRVEAEYGGWGVGSVTAMLCVVALLIFLPLGIGPGPIQPPSFSVLLIFPLFMAAILLFLFLASNTKSR
ncbi:PREDICTED: uncharacterized protein LOC105949687 [Erythranthe guttata]|uniref:uncharacterized protein LOC105949687 n=1 Tax=Erythranthe guttata TaxID=4155 RepID=UPI00064DB6F0|nr:PREDICTED: uncharacterized protein LOC105949687 [Erythranthe guttata]|eukprot:XP_012828459.1 PREDICTED: uncharacterized protein LOC105949687 [Erythranthe guttata]